MDRNRLPVVKQGLKIIKPGGTDTRETLMQSFEEVGRPKYAPMRINRELAAQVLAAGGSHRQAAARAGVSLRQIRKYVQSPDFRTRVDELRTLMLSKVRGRLIREVVRRTGDTTIKQMELMDLLRLWDRVMSPVGARGGGVNIQGDLNVNSQYDTLVQALLTSDAGSKGEDFQPFIIDGTAVPVDDPPF